MRILVLLGMGAFCTSYAMENRQEDNMTCGSVIMDYCTRIIIGNAQERIGLLVGQAIDGGNIQAPPEPIEERTCRECYQHNKKKIWCCGACCCMACTCFVASSISNIAS